MPSNRAALLPGLRDFVFAPDLDDTAYFAGRVKLRSGVNAVCHDKGVGTRWDSSGRVNRDAEGLKRRVRGASRDNAKLMMICDEVVLSEKKQMLFDTRRMLTMSCCTAI